MPEQQNPNDPSWDWLYAGPAGAPAEGEPTREIRRPSQAPDTEPDATAGAEPTQVVGEQPSPPPADSPEPTQVLGAAGPSPAPSAPPPAEPPSAGTSFGGTYPAPPPQQPQPGGPLYSPPYPQRAPAPPPPPPSRPPGPGPAGTGGGRPTVPTSRRKWIVRGVLIALAAWVVFLIAVPIWAWTTISQVDAEPAGQRPGDTPGTTYLMVGSDSRAGLSDDQRKELGTGDAGGERTDTIIVLHVPSGDGPRVLLSIPRDSFVEIPGHGEHKINAAFSIGGPKLLVETVEQATGIRIDDYIEIGFGGFVDVVDAVGGITICPETAIDDPKAGHLKLDKGCQEVDGATALGYSRSRAFPLGDITRGEHQREVIAAVGHKVVSWQTVVFPWRYLRVNLAAAESVRIGENVGPLDLARFAWAMSHTSGGDAKRCVVPYSSLGTPTADGSAVIWDDEAADALFAAIRQDDTASIRCSPTGKR